MSPVPRRRRILVGGAALFSDGGTVPRPLAKARVALDRLRALGEPVVLVSRELGGRSLPVVEGERIAWVRASLDLPWVQIVAFDESAPGRPTDAASAGTTQVWADLQSVWGADTLLTTHEAWVGAARQAGLTVIRIGARGPAADPTQPRADYEAFDLLDAVRHLLVIATFDESTPRSPADETPRFSAVVRAPAAPLPADGLTRVGGAGGDAAS